MPWDPFEDDRREELEPVYYDVPRHLNPELLGWLTRGLSDGRSLRVPLMQRVLNAMRLPPPNVAEKSYEISYYRDYLKRLCNDPNTFLSAVRALLKHRPDDGRARNLESILARANSGYAVRGDLRGLEYRVEPEVREQAEQVVADAPEHLGQLLTRAWNAAYGMDPRPAEAVTAAFGAAEATLRPIIAPGSGASLNRMINDYEAAPHKWESCLEESRKTFDAAKHTRLDAREVVLQMARSISYGQKDRHADGTSSNSIEEARAIVSMAVSIVALTNQGVVRRLPNQ